MECRLYRIEGHVQGVWFRESTRGIASPLGITGYARNMDDGSVEVLACGDQESLEKLSGWLKNGPPLAKVSQVEWRRIETDIPDSFQTG